MGYEDARSDFVIASRQSVTWGREGRRGKATMGKDTKQKGDRHRKQWTDRSSKRQNESHGEEGQREQFQATIEVEAEGRDQICVLCKRSELRELGGEMLHGL